MKSALEERTSNMYQLQCHLSINQSIKIYLATLEALEGDSKVSQATSQKKPQRIIQLNKSC